MKRFIEEANRHQCTLFPERLDDFIAEDNPVRVVDVFVDQLDLGELGFTKIHREPNGRPAYHPAVLIKLYIYGYLNRIHSSRRLERETHRNVELMWLIGKLSPDFKTIADFRKDNGKAIRGVCREFVVLCRHLDLFSQSMAVIDGSKFKAVNNRDKNFTTAKMKRRIEEVEKSIQKYLKRLDEADGEESSIPEDKTKKLQEKIDTLKQEMRRLQDLKIDMLKAPDKQISLTDPDARAMRSRGIGIVAYNVQTAVETEHHLIVAHDVIKTGSDRGQLTTMAQKAGQAMGIENLTAIADRGYYKSEEILACEEAGIKAIMPQIKTSTNQARGLFGRDKFHYLPETNEYVCPANERLIWRYRSFDSGRTMDAYWSSNCQPCELKEQCTPSKQRRMKRWKNEHLLEAVQARLDRNPNAMSLRRQTVEHPFGTLKAWMGYTHFLTKTLPNVRTEMSLHILAYNMKRVMNLLGVGHVLETLEV